MPAWLCAAVVLAFAAIAAVSATAIAGAAAGGRTATPEGEELERINAKVKARQQWLRSPEARQERRESRSAYRKLGKSDALDADRHAHPGVTKKPVWTGLPLHLGDRVVHFAGPFGAEIERGEGKGRAMVESAQPVALKSRDGKARPVDLRLRERNGGFVPETSPIEMRLAARIADGMALTGAGVRLVPLTSSDGDLSTEDARLGWTNVDVDTDFFVTPGVAGFETSHLLRSPESPELIRFRLEIPEGATLELVEHRPGVADDTVEVRRDGTLLATVSPAVAWDAQQASVPLTTSLEGSVLSVRVAHRDADFAYPIVVDPAVTDERVEGRQFWDDPNSPWYGKPQTGWSYTTTANVFSADNGYWGPARYFQTYAATLNASEYGEASFRAPGDSRIFEVHFNHLRGNYLHDDQGGACVTVGVYDDSRNAWDNSIDPNSCRNFDPTDPIFSKPGGLPPYYGYPLASRDGNRAVFKHWLRWTGWRGTHSVSTLGGAVVWIDDDHAPTVATANSTGSPDAWTQDGGSGVANLTGVDEGMGVQQLSVVQFDARTYDAGQRDVVRESFRWYPQADGSTNDQKCTGQSNDRCPRTLTDDVSHDTSGLPEGRNPVVGRVYDVLGRSKDTATWEVKIDRSAPEVEGTGSLFTQRVSKSGTAGVIKATDGSRGPRSQERSGVADIDVYVKRDAIGAIFAKEPDVPEQTCPASSCPMERSFSLNRPDGKYIVRAIVRDQVGRSTTKDLPVVIDSTGPKVEVSGSLALAENTILVAGAYSLHAKAVDCADLADASGTNRMEMLLRKPGSSAFVSVANKSRPQPTCVVEDDWSFRPEDNPEGEYTLRIVGHDELGTPTTPPRDLVFTVKHAPLPESGSRLGLEDYFDYRSVETGAGTAAHVNLATGNLVWHGLPLINRGRGLSTVANLTYNAHAPGTAAVTEYATAGRGFSLGISGITRINDRLDVAGAEAGKPILLTDADGTEHSFPPGGDGPDADVLPDHYEAPPGVHLHLRRFAKNSPSEQAWAATRPDGVTYFFDDLGYQTTVEDRNGNILRFEYEWALVSNGEVCTPGSDPINDLTRCARRVTGVTDAAGVVDGAANRTVKVEYWTSAEESARGSDPAPGASKTKVKALVDHGGRRLGFRYDLRGRLARLTQAEGAGIQSTGVPVERSFELGYEDDTVKARLSSIRDGRGAATRIDYSGSTSTTSLSPRLVQTIYNRRDARTEFHFGARANDAGTTARITPPRAYEDLPAGSEPRAGYGISMTYDHRGRLTRRVEADDTATALTWWDSINGVWTITRASGDTAQDSRTMMYYNANGQLTTSIDPLGNRTVLGYRNWAGPVKLRSERGTDDDDAFVSDLKTITRPKGYLSDTVAGDHQTRFVVSDEGNVRERLRSGSTLPAKFEYDRGQLTKFTDEVGNVTTYSDFDPNGLPRKEIDPKGNATPNIADDGVWGRRYDAVGNVLAVTDPRGYGKGGPASSTAPFTTTIAYDKLDRVMSVKSPRLSQSGDFGLESSYYDRNDNETARYDRNRKTWTTTYSPTDQILTAVTPSSVHAGETKPTGEPASATETTGYKYDLEENLIRETPPEGGRTPAADDFVTETRYDVVNQPVAEIQHSTRAGDPRYLITSHAYDKRGNRVGTVDPRTNAATTASQATLDEKVATAIANARDEGKLRVRRVYDVADQLTDEIEAPGKAGYAYKTHYGYDPNGNLVETIDPRGYHDPDPNDTTKPSEADYTTKRVYDERDWLTDITDPPAAAGGTTHYELRDDGKLQAEISPRGVKSGGGTFRTAYGYDGFGDLVEQTIPRAPGQYGPTGLRWRFVRNAVGDPETIIDPRGSEESGPLRDRYSIHNSFYDTGDLKTTDRPSFWQFAPGGDGPEVTAKPLDSLGNQSGRNELPSAGSQGDFGTVKPQDAPGLFPKKGPIELFYDKEMRLESVLERATSAATGNPCAEPTSDPGAICVNLTRDETGRVTGLKRPLDPSSTDPAQRLITEAYGYDRNGNLLESVDGEGQKTSMQYDQFGREVAQVAPGANEGSETTATEYDENGNVLVRRLPRSGTNERLTYDEVDRVQTRRNGMSSKYTLRRAEQPVDGEKWTYGYDAAGNQTSQISPRGHDDPAIAADPNATCQALASQTPRNTYEQSCFKSTTTYDALNRPVQSVNGFGRISEWAYDEDGNLSEEKRPGTSPGFNIATRSHVTARTYDGRGLPWTETTGTSRQRTTITEYDPIGNLRRVVNPEGVLSGQPKTADAAPLTTSPSDQAHRDDPALREATRNSTVFEYSEDNLLTSVHMPWDDQDTMLGAESGAGQDRQRYRQDFALDARGRVKSIDAPYEWTLSTHERCAERPQTTENPGCTARTGYEYYETGWIRTSSDPVSVNPSSKRRGGGRRISYAYDRRGLQNRWEVYANDGQRQRTITRAFFDNGLLRHREGRKDDSDAKPRIYDYEYDRNRNLTRMIDRKGTGDADDRTTTISYDLADREIRVNEKFDHDEDTLLFRDAEGNVIRRLTDGHIETEPEPDEYSANGKETRLWFDPLGRNIRGEINRDKEPRRAFDITYHQSGQRAIRKKRTGDAKLVVDQWWFADDGRVLKTRRGKEGDADLNDLKDQDYSYDDNGNRMSDERGEYSYNSRDQLTGWKRSSAEGKPHPGTLVRYWLNGSGQQLKKRDEAPASALGGTTTYSYTGEELDKAHLDSSDGSVKPLDFLYTYTPLGSVKQISIADNDNNPDNDVQPTEFDFDPYDRLIGSKGPKERRGTNGAAPTQYDYDALDRRDTKCSGATGSNCAEGRKTDLSYVGLSERLSAETPLNAAADPERSYDYGGDLDPLGTAFKKRGDAADAAPTYRPYATDVLGSVEGLEQADGSLSTGDNSQTSEKEPKDSYDYDPYGNLQQGPGTSGTGVDTDVEATLSPEAGGNPMRFEGFAYDGSTRTYDMQARQYLPSAGRFLTEDRFEDSVGDFSLQSDVLTQNRYAFAGGNPVNRIEFDGHKCVDEPGGSHCKFANSKGQVTPQREKDQQTWQIQRVPVQYSQEQWRTATSTDPKASAAPAPAPPSTSDKVRDFLRDNVLDIAVDKKCLNPRRGCQAVTIAGNDPVKGLDQITGLIPQGRGAKAAVKGIREGVEQAAKAYRRLKRSRQRASAGAGAGDGVVRRPRDSAAGGAGDDARHTVTALTREQDAAVSATLRDPNKLRHIFDKPEHNLGGLTRELGGRESVVREAVLAVPRRTTGTFEVSRQVGRYNLTVRGRVVNGVPRIGTVFVP
ncbi:MAG TPA: RHS repeat-associated core domain-containing protein [Solirubrobacteraceae bacterium]